jgi:hypothetical protein
MVSKRLKSLTLAIRITTEHPDYRLFENNCQNFVKYLIGAISPTALVPNTIQSVLDRLYQFRDTDHRLPGTFPHSPQSIGSHYSSPSVYYSALNSPANSVLSGNKSSPAMIGYQSDGMMNSSARASPSMSPGESPGIINESDTGTMSMTEETVISGDTWVYSLSLPSIPINLEHNESLRMNRVNPFIDA